MNSVPSSTWIAVGIASCLAFLCTGWNDRGRSFGHGIRIYFQKTILQNCEVTVDAF